MLIFFGDQYAKNVVSIKKYHAREIRVYMQIRSRAYVRYKRRSIRVLLYFIPRKFNCALVSLARVGLVVPKMALHINEEPRDHLAPKIMLRRSSAY